jgi:hypothetical protein
MKQVSIHRIYSKLRRDLGIDDIPESDVIEWTGEALEAIGAVTGYEEAVAFSEVSNFETILPNFLHAIIQVAKNNDWTEDDKKCFCPKDIIDAGATTIEVATEVETEEVVLPCDACATCDLTDELSVYVPNIESKYNFGVWVGSNYYISHYSPVRLADHTFFNSIVCEQAPAIYDGIRNEYTIINGEKLRFSFQTGFVAIAYYRQITDDDGYPMIPEHYYYTKAITAYVNMMLKKQDFYNNREGSDSRYQMAQTEWHQACSQAANYAAMPKTVDEYQNFLDQSQHFFPKMKRYYGFFGKLSNPEIRKYNKSNYFNYDVKYF